MSALPKYRKDMDEEESAPLYKNDQFVLEDTDEAVPSYPPRVGQCSAGPASEQNNVKYTFVPRWPIEGDVQNALGVLGRTKEDTIAIVQRGFATLATFPPHRIEFLAPMQTEADNKREEQWGIVMDEAWAGFQYSPPSHLRVQVQDAPGEEAARKARETRNNTIVALSLILGLPAMFGSVFFIIYLCGGFED